MLLSIIKKKFKKKINQLFKQNNNITERSRIVIKIISQKDITRSIKLKNFCLLSGKYKSCEKNTKISRHQLNKNLINGSAQNYRINSW